MKKSQNPGCPCGGPSYAACCAPFIEGGVLAPSAQQLMRSRYTAYTLGKDAYLQRTWHASTRPAGPVTEPGTKWMGLDVLSHAEQDDEATVEFVARYKLGGRAHRLHELSRFVREGGAWYYVDGSFPERQA